MTEQRVMLLGQAPGHYGREAGAPVDPRLALFNYPPNCAGARLQRLLGAGNRLYLRGFERRNLLGYWPGGGGSGDLFPVRDARDVAERLLPTLAGRRVLVLGVGTARALGLEPEVLRYQYHRDATFGVIPHTSGRCRFYNDPASRAAAEAFAREFCQVDIARARMDREDACLFASAAA